MGRDVWAHSCCRPMVVPKVSPKLHLCGSCSPAGACRCVTVVLRALGGRGAHVCRPVGSVLTVWGGCAHRRPPAALSVLQSLPHGSAPSAQGGGEG